MVIISKFTFKITLHSVALPDNSKLTSARNNYANTTSSQPLMLLLAVFVYDPLT